MKRTTILILCGSILLSACGGGGDAPAAGAADGAASSTAWKTKLNDAMKPCDSALKAADKVLTAVRSRRMPVSEAREIVNEAVTACEKASADWRGRNIPESASACLEQADALLGQARAQRAALDHQVSQHYQKRIKALSEAADRREAACKAAQSA